MTTPYITELTPLSFLERAAAVYPDKIAIVSGARRSTYAEFAAEATRVAHALRGLGIGPGDRVAYLAPNVPELLVAHFAVPLAGAVLVAINTRLAGEEIRHILDHSGARVLVVDASLVPVIRAVAGSAATVEHIVIVGSADLGGVATMTYEELLASGSGEPLPWSVADERSTISINYTSGTTGVPKGVMYAHRGGYLNALGEIIHSRHTPGSVYLWTLPMFHCNGWCTPWAVTAIGGTHVCLDRFDAETIWRLIGAERVTHLNAAPTVLTMLLNSPLAAPLDRPVVATTAGAPPSPTLIELSQRLGFHIVHVYGLTETYGPYSVCERQDGWEDLDTSALAGRLARQGVGMLQTDGLRVVDAGMRDVAADGATIGEIVMRGNNVMKGYLADDAATAKAFEGGWFHSGDLGVMHTDGYVELRDRGKDIVISGGENISTVEVEQAVVSHPAVLEATVIAVPDERWGERPKAFVVPRPGATVTARELIEHLRGRIAGFKVPDSVEFTESLPKTATGKIKKFELREREWRGHDKRIQG